MAAIDTHSRAIHIKAKYEAPPTSQTKDSTEVTLTLFVEFQGVSGVETGSSSAPWMLFCSLQIIKLVLKKRFLK